MQQLRAEHVASVGAALGEGPVWDAVRGELTFVDILAGRLHRLGPGDHVETVHELGGTLAAALPTTEGDRLLVTHTGFVRLAADSTRTPVLDVLDDAEQVRFNDAKCDPAGRCLAGTMSLVEAPAAGTLFRVGPGPTAIALVTEVTLSNGLDWSPDGATFYFVDTLRGSIGAWAYDVDTGTLSDRRVALDVSPESPDGMCVDDAGALWVAFWDGGVVRRYAPDGRCLATVTLPVPKVTSCAFGGRDGDVLYITTATGLRPGQAGAALAGDLFAVRPGVTGRPATPWRPSSVVDN